MSARLILSVLIMNLGAVGAGISQSAPIQSSRVPQDEQAVFSLSISTPQDVVRVGTEAVLKIDVTNASDHEVRLNSSNGVSEIGAIVVRNEQGKAPLSGRGKKLAAGNDILVGGDHSISVQPGKTMTERVAIPKTYDLSQPGTYTIQVQKRDPYSKIVVKSNTITLTVTP